MNQLFLGVVKTGRALISAKFVSKLIRLIIIKRANNNILIATLVIANKSPSSLVASNKNPVLIAKKVILLGLWISIIVKRKSRTKMFPDLRVTVRWESCYGKSKNATLSVLTAIGKERMQEC